MNPNGDFNVPLRLNNTIFQCKIDGKHYNVLLKKAYAVQIIAGIVIDPATKRPAVGLDAAVICEDCYKDKQYDLKEPSPIVVPTVDEKKVADAIVGPKGTTINKK